MTRQDYETYWAQIKALYHSQQVQLLEDAIEALALEAPSPWQQRLIYRAQPLLDELHDRQRQIERFNRMALYNRLQHLMGVRGFIPARLTYPGGLVRLIRLSKPEAYFIAAQQLDRLSQRHPRGFSLELVERV